jgi:hypothetical protein
MGWISLFTGSGRRERMQWIARQLAETCEADVWDRIERRIATMPLGEARGYVRARARSVVRRTVEVYESRLTKGPADTDQLLASTTDHVVSRVMGTIALRRAATAAQRRAA